MPYMIATYDKPGHEHVRDRVRAAHLAFLEAHVDRVIAGGGLFTEDASSVIGGLLLFEGDTEEDARAFIAQDPFSHADLFERVEIVRWRPSFFEFARLAPGTDLKLRTEVKP